FFETRTRAELFAGARARNIILLPVLRLEELLEDEHLRARGAFQPATGAPGRFRVPAFPVRAPGIESERRAPRVLAGDPEPAGGPRTADGRGGAADGEGARPHPDPQAGTPLPEGGG